jgi:hypothetical protein
MTDSVQTIRRNKTGDKADPAGWRLGVEYTT